MKKNIIKTTTKKLNKATEKVLVGTTVAGVTVGCCVLCTAMDLTESAMSIGAIAILTPFKVANTNAAIVKRMYKAVKEA